MKNCKTTKGEGRNRRIIDNALDRMQDAIGGPLRFRISKRGVPHIVGDLITGNSYSVCYFFKQRVFKLFFPYAKYGPQEVWTANTPEGIVQQLDNLIEREYAWKD